MNDKTGLCALDIMGADGGGEPSVPGIAATALIAWRQYESWRWTWCCILKERMLERQMTT
jgi:hypothetical protein